MTRDDDRAKFVKLASTRVSKAMSAIRLIGNLSNRSNYDYTDEDVTRIFKALNEEVTACKRKFESARTKGARTAFVLD